MPESVRPEGFDPHAADSPATDQCPECGASSINVHGLLDCPACSWSG